MTIQSCDSVVQEEPMVGPIVMDIVVFLHHVIVILAMGNWLTVTASHAYIITIEILLASNKQLGSWQDIANGDHLIMRCCNHTAFA